MKRALLGPTALLASLLPIARAEAQTAPARDLDGLKAYQERRYQDAVDILRDDLRRHPLPTSAFTLGLAFEQLGDWVQAAGAHRLALGLAAAGSDEEQQLQLRARQDATEQLASLEKRIPKLSIVVEAAAPRAVTVEVDGAEVPAATLGQPLQLNPGNHVLRARCQTSNETQLKSIALHAMTQTEVSLSVPCAETAARPQTASAANTSARAAEGSSRPFGTWEWLGIGLSGAGVVALGTGSYFLASALGNKHDAEPYCNGDYCFETRGEELRRTAAQQGRRATACAIGGGSLLLVGVGLFAASRAGWIGASQQPAIAFDVDVQRGRLQATYERRF